MNERQGLVVSGVDEALRAAMARQAALLAKVERARAKVIALDRELEQVHAEMRGQAAERVEALRARDRAIHAMFVELATDKRQRRQIRVQIEDLHAELSDDTVLTAAGYAEAWAAHVGATSARRAAAPVEDEPDLDEREDDDADDVAPAPRGDDSLRGLFRRLAETLHPDKVQDPEAKAARTEVMKQVTVAYREGDVARLLELERAWMAQVEVATLDEQARRLALVEQSIAELEAQLRELTRTRRAMRRSPSGEMLRALGPARERPARLAKMVGAMCRELDRELATLTTFHDHVAAFRAGTITLDELIVGPPVAEVEEPPVSSRSRRGRRAGR